MALIQHLIRNEILGVSSGGGGIGTLVTGIVSTFALLPVATSNTNKVYYVQNTTGIYLINRKVAGYYKSDGTNWNVWETDQQAIDVINALTAANIGYTNASLPTLTDVKLALDYFLNSYFVKYSQTVGIGATITVASFPMLTFLLWKFFVGSFGNSQAGGMEVSVAKSTVVSHSVDNQFGDTVKKLSLAIYELSGSLYIDVTNNNSYPVSIVINKILGE